MKFSLIMATLGRTREVEGFLASLDAQSYRDFELIVVDQNPDDRLAPLLNLRRTRFPILHLRSKPGLSRARNVGLEHVTGEVVGFPDDDCRYPPHLLERVVRLLQEHANVDGIAGRVGDERGSFDARFDSSTGLLNLSNVWQRTAMVCLFLRDYVVRRVGKFDETLGPNSGMVWGGGEDIDYSLRAIEAGFKVQYDPVLQAFHPNRLRYGYRGMSERAYTYGAGIGRVWRKHDYPVWLVAYYLLRPLGGTILSFMAGRKDKAYYHWSALRGRLRGWISK